MSCVVGTSSFRIDPTSELIPVNSDNANVCSATVILDRLHKEFTEKYTASTDDLRNHPTFHLRTQPGDNVFNNQEVAGTNVDRFYNIFTTNGDTHPVYKGTVNAIMKGNYDNSVININQYPEEISELNDFTKGSIFKGVFGLHKVTELLNAGISEKVAKHMPTADYNFRNDIFSKYQKRQGVKETIEEIARRENQLYREKFLNIILILVGLFIVSTQLVNKYFSFGGGGGGGGGGFGFGGVGGWLSTRFGSGGSGLFSRFGGIGLGSSGRSRVGNLFTRSPYASSPR